MSKDELLDLVNEDDEIIGEVWRSEAHKDPSKIHREIAVSIFNADKKILVQQRSLNKHFAPGKWTLAAAGHVDKGELPGLAAERELNEETGLDPELHFVGKKLDKQESQTRIFWIYTADVENGVVVSIDKIETEQYKWVDKEDLKKLDMDDYVKEMIHLCSNYLESRENVTVN